MSLIFISNSKLSREERDRVRRTFFLICSLFFFVIFLFFWSIQIIKHQSFKNLSLNNVLRTVFLEAPRGKIYDQKGRVLAENRLQFTLKYIRENIQDKEQSFEILKRFSHKDEQQLKKIIEKYKAYPDFFPITVRNNLSLQEVIFLKARSEEYPELEIFFAPYRSYPVGSSAAHILGYVGEISEQELTKVREKNYRQGDFIGKFGLEKNYEDYLRGEKGTQTVMKDFQERTQKIVDEKAPQSGCDLFLTIDFGLQQFIENQMQNLRGTVAVMELTEGGVLALISKPDFNPESFSNYSPEQWQSLLNDPYYPLQNRFIQGLYSPGSVFKIVMAVAALQEGIIDARSTFFCSGVTYIYDNPFRCWFPGGHGEVTVREALEKSCNIFFYNLGKKLDIDVIARYARMLGLGVRTGIDLEEEKAGTFPDSDWKMKKFAQKWFPGETISIAIGQGQISITPAQLLQMISIIALRGEKLKMHLVKEIRKGENLIWQFKPEKVSLPLNKDNLEIVVDGLARVVKSGTGIRAQLDGLEICGKTGTAQVISKKNPLYEKVKAQEMFKPHSWFVSFAPRTNPKYALVVLVENGGDAGAIAAPLAARIYDYLFRSRQ